jgi:hypothetical protein
MTGPEHYREAEVLMADADEAGSITPEGLALIALAQVHATLALAAATALHGSADAGQPMSDDKAWRAAAATPNDYFQDE